MLDIREKFEASGVDSALIVSAAKLGAFVGTFLGGAAMYKYGRSRSIGGNSVFFIVGPLLMATSATIVQLVIGRFVIGIGIGVSAVVIPAYLAEMAPQTLRGTVVVTYEVLLCVGMLASILVDAALAVCTSRLPYCHVLLYFTSTTLEMI
jgi:MFS family permease